MKVVFLIPYFGKFNNFFQLFLNSCRENMDYTWMIFTDDNRQYFYPSNVHVFYYSFQDICKMIHEKISNEAVIDRPYKLCDYKPCYGLIFEDYIKEFDFWGYCDVDMLFGKISNFIKPEMLEKYDKLFFLGHCTLIRNNFDNNSIFLGEPEFKRVIKDARNHSFDEEFENSINNIYKRKGKEILLCEYEANLLVKSNYFYITRYDFSRKEYIKLIQPYLFFVWDKGILTGIWKDRDTYVSAEYMYIHFQSRKMKNMVCSTDRFKIIPNSFEDIETNDYVRIKKRHLNMNYIRVRGKNLIMKMKKCIIQK